MEAVYRKALNYELGLRGVLMEEEKILPVLYKEQLMGQYQADIVVDNKIILALKAVSAISKAHEAQAMHYLVATGLKLAIIINFGAASPQQKRIVK